MHNRSVKISSMNWFLIFVSVCVLLSAGIGVFAYKDKKFRLCLLICVPLFAVLCAIPCLLFDKPVYTDGDGNVLATLPEAKYMWNVWSWGPVPWYKGAALGAFLGVFIAVYAYEGKRLESEP
jgi:hypothetical protein